MENCEENIDDDIPFVAQVRPWQTTAHRQHPIGCS